MCITLSYSTLGGGRCLKFRPPIDHQLTADSWPGCCSQNLIVQYFPQAFSCRLRCSCRMPFLCVVRAMVPSGVHPILLSCVWVVFVGHIVLMCPILLLSKQSSVCSYPIWIFFGCKSIDMVLQLDFYLMEKGWTSFFSINGSYIYNRWNTSGLTFNTIFIRLSHDCNTALGFLRSQKCYMINRSMKMKKVYYCMLIWLLSGVFG